MGRLPRNCVKKKGLEDDAIDRNAKFDVHIKLTKDVLVMMEIFACLIRF
jgi:hypothetical protein